MSGLSYLERAQMFYRRLWADNGTHSEEYIINELARFIRETEQSSLFMGWIFIFPAFVTGLFTGVALIYISLILFR